MRVKKKKKKKPNKLSAERSLKTDVTQDNWQNLAMKYCYMLFSVI